MKKSGLILIILLLVTIIASGCEVKRSEEEIREEIKAELEAEQAAEAAAAEAAEKEAAIKVEEEQGNQLDKIENDQTLKIMTERLNVRREPVLDSTKLGLITNEKTYEILDEEVRTDGYKWYKIMYEPEVEGWIAGWYTLKNIEFSEQIGRGNLLKAFDGKLDGVTVGLGENISLFKQAYGEADLMESFNGGDIYVYGGLSVFTYGDMGGDIEIGDIAFYSYERDTQVFGIKVGMTSEEVMGVIGKPDFTELDVTDEYTNMYTNNDIHKYFTGSYEIFMVYNQQGVLQRVELFESN